MYATYYIHISLVSSGGAVSSVHPLQGHTFVSGLTLLWAVGAQRVSDRGKSLGVLCVEDVAPSCPACHF